MNQKSISFFLREIKSIQESNPQMAEGLYEYIGKRFNTNIWPCIESLKILISLNEKDRFLKKLSKCKEAFSKHPQYHYIASFEKIDFDIISTDSYYENNLFSLLLKVADSGVEKLIHKHQLFSMENINLFKADAQDRFSFPEIDILRYDSVVRVVSPGLIVDDNLSIITSLKQHNYLAISSEWLNNGGIAEIKKRILSKKEKCLNGNYILLSRRGDNIYGHWLIDILPKVYFAEQYKSFFFKYILSSDTPEYVYELLEIFGVDRERIYKWDRNSEVLKLTHIFMVSPLRYGNFFHKEIRNYSNFIIKHFGISKNKAFRKIYISRRAWKSTQKNIRVLENSIELEECARKLGFEIIRPENYPFEEQVKIFTESSIVIGEDGSAMHNSIFSQPGTIFINLRSDLNGSLIQGHLCSTFEQEIFYVIGKTVKNDNSVKRNSTYFIDKELLLYAIKEAEKSMISEYSEE